MKPHFRFLILAVLAVLLVACSANSEGTNSDSEKVEFTIEMTEFSYEPDAIELKVGQTVTINLVNHGLIDHEVMIGREVEMDNSLPSGYEVDLFEQAGIEPVMAMDMDMDMGEHEEADAGHDDAEHAEDESGHMEGEHHHHGFMVSLAKEETATMTFTVTKDMVGTWEMGCFLQDGAHYLAHMKGTVVVNG